MKAITFKKYGTPEVLEYGRAPVPQPAPHEILVKVRSASLNALDKHLSRGVILARPKTGLFKPKFGILGSDLAGEVIATGKSVTRYKEGDRVFGARLWGAFAEYACLTEEKATLIPDGVSYQEAAAIPVAGVTALQGLRHGGITIGQEVLINGAAGGVGTYSVQLAKHFGARVTAVCSGKNVSLISALGADRVINYQTDDVRNEDQAYDLVLDNVGNLTINDCKRLTYKGGAAVVVGYNSTPALLGFMLRGPLAGKMSGRKFSLLDTSVNSEDLSFLVDLVDKKAIRSLIDQEYEMANVHQAMEYLWTRRVKSKLVLNI